MRAAKLNFFLVFTVSICACSLQGNAQKKPEPPVSRKQATQESRKKESVDYEPAVVELKGSLVVKTYFGPPNYGEDPETDSREEGLILSLDSPIDVRGKTGPDAGYESPSVEDVRELQLVLSIPHKELIGRKVIVKGTLFHAHTGHHHTDVLMDVRSIGLAAPD